MRRPTHKSRVLLIATLTFIPMTQAAADTATVRLFQSSQVATSTAVSNTSTGEVHPPLQIQGWDSGGGAQSTSISIGDGSHGSFNSATYLNFHSGNYNGDRVVRIDTDAYPELKFTDFTLDDNWTLEPIGSRPLVIRSLSTVVINGAISCTGSNGSDLDSATAVTPSGGTGRCGGASGGSGGSLTSAASSGSEPTTNAGSRGRAGAAQQGGGGGGGGMDTSAPAPATGLQIDDATPSGAAGTTGTDTSFTLVGGGAGGGGGERYDNGAAPVNQHSSGGGGGAGGGSIYIYAKGNITVRAGTGFVRAKGGNGGGSTGTGRAGAGGGGAGGSILIFSGGQFVVNGVVDAGGGTGGTSDGGNGGNGGAGRTWSSDSDTNPSGTGTIDPGSSLGATGSVTYQIGTFEVVSALIDLGTKKPSLNSISIDSTVSGASTISLEVAGGDDSFDDSAATWVSSSSLASVTGKRFLRLRLRINNQDNATPAVVRAITINFDPSNQGKFDFTSCQMVRGTGGGSGLWSSAFVTMLLPLLLLGWLRRRAF